VTAPGTGIPRWTRGALVALVTLLLSVTAHVAAGGAVPRPTVLAAAAAGIAGFAVVASSRQWTKPRAVAVVVVAQAGLHSLFSLTAPMTGMAHLGRGPGAVMLSMHLLAALLVALVLARGDAVLWRLAAVLTTVFVMAVALLARLRCRPVAARRFCAPGPVRRRTTSPARFLLRARCLTRRGPPHLATV
jgi:hypothetical protein